MTNKTKPFLPAEVPADLREWLDREAMRVNSLEFIPADPVQFPRRFSRQQDIETVGRLSAPQARGDRKLRWSKSEKILRKNC